MRLLFRADGNNKIGLGHVMRLLALAEMLQPDFSGAFAIQEPTPTIYALIEARGLHLIVLPAQKDYLREAKWLIENVIEPHDVLVLDGYNFDTDYQQMLRQHVTKLFCLDDIHAFLFEADVVINAAGSLDTQQYQLASHTQLVTGPDYALLRKPFLRVAQQQRNIKDIRRIFLNMGGADPQNHTLQILQQVKQLRSNLKLEVVLGSAYQKREDLYHLINQAPEINVQVYQNLRAEAMCDLMLQCDAAICPPSTVAYEWCAVSGPLFILRTADNQKHLEAFLLNQNLAFPYNQLPAVVASPDSVKLTTMQIQQRLYFHGQNRDKWRELFFKQIYPAWLHLRRVTQADCMLLFYWVNEPEVRRYSFSQAPVPLEIHQNWFEKKLLDENSFIFIAEINSQPAGMIRFDIQESEALISYLLAKAFRGKGLGTAILTKGIQAFRAFNPKADKVIGLVQSHNIASIKAFEKSGFRSEIFYSTTQQSSVLKFTLAI